MSRPSSAPPARAAAAATPAPGVDGALVAAALVAALCVAATATFPIYEGDFWQHLTVGKAIWERHSVPTRNLWTWPSYEAPAVTPSWGFRALVWPFWVVGGAWGLQAWRWVTTLGIFALAWATCRRMGGRGFAPLLVVVVASLIYRERAQVRPETLASLLLALEIWILETRRHGGPDRSKWIVPLAWVWANAHISYFLCFVVLGAHLLGAGVAGARSRGAAMTKAPARSTPSGRRLLGRIALLALAVSFVNPFGWRALWQPFDFLLHERNEPLFRTIGELAPTRVLDFVGTGLPIIVVAWPVLFALRWRREGFDLVEALLLAFFTFLGLGTLRFLGFYAVVVAAYLGRDLDSAVRARRWPARCRAPWTRAGVAAAACVLAGIPTWTARFPRLGVGIDMSQFPVGACDAIAENGVAGRAFNEYFLGGYMLWSFWPDRDRLPFIDIHQTGTKEDRLLYVKAHAEPSAWRQLDRRHRFDYALINRRAVPWDDRLLDILDADSSWALVFLDDAASLHVKRGGRDGALAESAYREVPAGRARWQSLLPACASDASLRARVAAELTRQAAASPYNATAHMPLAEIAFIEGRVADAREHLLRALAADPFAPRVRERLGVIALVQGNPREALGRFVEETEVFPGERGIYFRMGQAYRALGDTRRAAAYYRRELSLDPSHQEARDSLRVLAAAGRG